MKNIRLILVSILFSTMLIAESITVKDEGVSYIKMLGKELKSNLQKEMQADPSGVSAMGFCTGKADEITTKINASLPKHTSVRRTALKTRSEKNSPDVIDIEVMQAYLAGDEGIKVMEKDGVHRVYKPLMVGKACLKCHGSEKHMHPEIKSVIAKMYPKDMAINMKEGDFRGVIVSEITK